MDVMERGACSWEGGLTQPGLNDEWESQIEDEGVKETGGIHGPRQAPPLFLALGLFLTQTEPHYRWLLRRLLTVAFLEFVTSFGRTQQLRGYSPNPRWQRRSSLANCASTRVPVDDPDQVPILRGYSARAEHSCCCWEQDPNVLPMRNLKPGTDNYPSNIPSKMRSRPSLGDTVFGGEDQGEDVIPRAPSATNGCGGGGSCSTRRGDLSPLFYCVGIPDLGGSLHSRERAAGL
ncbi:hypothetical protein EDB84DRAFT_1676170 [Lactarius hengduanensis]|nr:hypothetical protein EDB84DRAFT_1676170 [Lactarius hengduanensis]